MTRFFERFDGYHIWYYTREAKSKKETLFCPLFHDSEIANTIFYFNGAQGGKGVSLIHKLCVLSIHSFVEFFVIVISLAFHFQ